MAIHFSHPQVILYWTELIIGIICVALAGRGYNEAFVQYLITVSALFSLGDIAFLFVYGFATSRPIEGWSITKIIETVYQMLAALLYCIGFGSTVNSAEYLHPFIGPLTVFNGEQRNKKMVLDANFGGRRDAGFWHQYVQTVIHFEY
ncbi:hypothetical protein CRM22_006454 [Opisthorchis felineus]|uniref:MARVEL domain-containing protein n=1 Tax=Opisthorchis felineus TaxID=147828 RepID=A0A4S2LS86_OPIFE|nr:hypothetical protein CRM22_006454 [Opisthorchis felineus]